MMKYNFINKKVVLILFTALLLHIWAIALLPEDYDEPVYLQNGFDYAEAVRSGGVQAVIDYSGNSEHPPLVKLLYGAEILIMGEQASWVKVFYAARSLSALFGILAVAIVLIFISPLSGLFLAINTLMVKYSSQAYLEAIPLTLMILSILTFAKLEKQKISKWFWISAVALGFTAASKYSYVPVLVMVLLYLAIFEKKLPLSKITLFFGVGIAIFFILDIHLWNDPINRLVESLKFHVQYSRGAHVREINYPWYQPFIWIFSSAPAAWHPDVFFYYGLDGLMGVVTILSLKREWRERRWLFMWFLFGITFVLIWPTKWPQYVLIITPVICIISAESFSRVFNWVKANESYWDYAENFIPKPTKWFWVTLITFLMLLGGLYISSAGKKTVGLIGWSTINSQTSLLPSNTVNAVLPLENGKVAVGTSNGAAIWNGSGSMTDQQSWDIFNTTNSGLVSGKILSLAEGTNGNLWLGTSEGLSMYDGNKWQSYHGEELCLTNDAITAIAISEGGTVYVGSLQGASAFNGATWKKLDFIGSNPIFSMSSYEEELWIGTDDGVWLLDLTQRSELFYETPAAVTSILRDSTGIIWFGTSGAGLASLKNGMLSYSNNSNSEVPFNTINWICEVKPGVIWIATAEGASAGGQSCSFDGKSWHCYKTNDSGVSGSEPLVISIDQDNQIWIGTRTQGIDLYKPGR